jgi:hypothetical protein
VLLEENLILLHHTVDVRTDRLHEIVHGAARIRLAKKLKRILKLLEGLFFWESQDKFVKKLLHHVVEG